MRKSFALLLFLLLAASRLLAATPDRWIQIRTDHFLVITNSSEKDARHTAAQFERMRAVFKFLMPTAGSDTSVITVLALRGQKEFQSIEPAAYLAKNQLSLAGYFLDMGDRNFIIERLDSQNSEEHPYATVYHEYTHFLNKRAQWLPLWLNEGSAEFYQNTDIGEKEVMLGQPSSDDILYLRQQKLIPLATLLAVDHNSPYYHEEQKGSVFYAESWALTHYLIVNDRVNNTHRLADYAKDLVSGQDPVAAAMSAFGDLKKLQSNLDNYVSQERFSQFKTEKAFPMDESTFKVEPLPTTDANAVRAEILLGNGRTQEAVALVDTVLASDPKNPAAYEALGTIRLHQGDHEAARKAFETAVKLDSKSYLAQFYSADLALRDDADPSPIEAGLNASIKLNPSFAPAYDALAQLYARNHEKLQQAHLANLYAIKLDPGNVGYRINTAMVLMEEEQPENAINVLKAAEKFARPTELAILQGRIRDIESQQASNQQQPEAVLHSKAVEIITTTSTTGGDDPDKRIVTTDHGHLVREDGQPQLPTQANGPRRTVKGIVTNVKCYYPSALVLSIAAPSAKPLHLYVNNYFKVEFYTMNFEPKGDLKPCTGIEGLKASIDYTEVTPADPNVDGQILKVELTK